MVNAERLPLNMAFKGSTNNDIVTDFTFLLWHLNIPTAVSSSLLNLERTKWAWAEKYLWATIVCPFLGGGTFRSK
jgi:hypothetical protein